MNVPYTSLVQGGNLLPAIEQDDHSLLWNSMSTTPSYVTTHRPHLARHKDAILDADTKTGDLRVIYKGIPQ